MRNLNLSVAFLIGTLALTGCSRNPVAPQANVPTEPSATLGRGLWTGDPEPPQGGEAGAVGTISVASQEAGVMTVGRSPSTRTRTSMPPRSR